MSCRVVLRFGIIAGMTLLTVGNVSCRRKGPPAAQSITLTQAAIHYPERIVELIKAGQDVNQRDENGVTPLLNAATFQKSASTAALLEGGADPNLADARGQRPLPVAARAGDAASVRLLLKHGAETNAKSDGHAAIHWAAIHGRATMIEELLEEGADINLTETATGRTPLHLATAQGHVEVVKLFLEKGARSDIRDGIGQTPLEFIRQGGSEQIRGMLETATTRSTASGI